MIRICYPTVSAIVQRHTTSCLLCFFNNPYISPFLISRIFVIVYITNYTCVRLTPYCIRKIFILHRRAMGKRKAGSLRSPMPSTMLLTVLSLSLPFAIPLLQPKIIALQPFNLVNVCCTALGMDIFTCVPACDVRKLIHERFVLCCLQHMIMHATHPLKPVGSLPLAQRCLALHEYYKYNMAYV